MGMKAFFALAIAVGCGLIGRACAGAQLRRAGLIAEMRRALVLLRVRMLEGKEPLRTALQHSACPIFARVGAGMREESAGAAWQSLRRAETRHGRFLDALREEELRTLDALFSGLGASGTSGQEALLDNALRALERLEAETAAQCAGRTRLYTTLGLLLGMALALCAL